MGKTIDAILGRKAFKASKFRSLTNLAASRLSVFKNQRQVRCNQARSDAIQLLQQSHHERALLRVEHLIKEQNMLDVYVMIEGHCNLLVERLHLIEQDRVCPDELQEAVSTLLHASTRCGDFPELQEIRTVLTSWYGKEFAARAIELRNNCGVNPKIIQKLSTRQPDLDYRMKVLKEIASENNIALQLEEASITTEEKLNTSKKHNQSEPDTSTNSGTSKVNDNLQNLPEDMDTDGLSDSSKVRKKYKDVADAAQAAFESAANAAAAARAAVELSRSESHDPDNQSSPKNQGRNIFNKDEHMKLNSEPMNQEINNENESTESEDDNAVEQRRQASSSTPNSVDDVSRVNSMYLDAEYLVKQLDKDIVFDESDDENQHSAIKTRSGKTEVQAVEKEIPSIVQAGVSRERGRISVRTKGVRGY